MEDNDSRALQIEEEKHSIRLAMRRKLAALEPGERRVRSEQLISHLAALPAWQNARTILLFAPMPSEPDLDLLWSAGDLGGKECVYPRVAERELDLYRVESPDDLWVTPPWNLREPSPGTARRVQLDAVDLMLVPGLAFDGRGGRLGRGGGFYDRLLATRHGGRPFTAGIGFAFQQMDWLPLAPHDALLDTVVFC